MPLGLEFACLILLCGQEPEKPNQDLAAFIGSDACRTELQGSGAGFGMALDRNQRAFVETRQLNGKPTLLLIQYAKDGDRCGTLRDIVVAPDPKDVFELDCVDQTNAKHVVVGVHQGPEGARHWKASKSWVVDFEKLKLSPTNESVTCLNYDYSGGDDGSDIRTRAAARAKKKAH
jgi:hypothetical protein